MPPVGTSEYSDVKVRVGASSAFAPGLVHPPISVEKGGTLTLTNDSTDYPDFEVQVKGSAEKLTGNPEKPVVLHMPPAGGTVEFYVRQKDKHGNVIHEELRAAHGCGPCP
jgi:hypothetical protein